MQEGVKKLLWTWTMSIALAVVRRLGWGVGTWVQVPALLRKTRLILLGGWPRDGWVFWDCSSPLERPFHPSTERLFILKNIFVALVFQYNNCQSPCSGAGRFAWRGAATWTCRFSLCGSACEQKSQIDLSLTAEPIATCILERGRSCHGLCCAETLSVGLILQSQSIFTLQISPCTFSGENLCFGGMVSLAWACLCAKGNSSWSNLAF